MLFICSYWWCLCCFVVDAACTAAVGYTLSTVYPNRGLALSTSPWECLGSWAWWWIPVILVCSVFGVLIWGLTVWPRLVQIRGLKHPSTSVSQAAEMTGATPLGLWIMPGWFPLIGSCCCEYAWISFWVHMFSCFLTIRTHKRWLISNRETHLFGPSLVFKMQR